MYSLCLVYVLSSETKCCVLYCRKIEVLRKTADEISAKTGNPVSSPLLLELQIIIIYRIYKEDLYNL